MRKRICGIYGIKNTKTNKFYVGQSVSILNRWVDHRRDLKEGTHHSEYLQRSYNKHGVKCFIYGIIEECSKEKLNEKEIYWINFYNSKKNGYNCAEPTINGGRVFSEEDKKQVSINTKRYHDNPAFKEKREKAVKKSLETRYKNAALGLTKLGGPEIDVNLRFYDKDSLELKHKFKYLREGAEFLGVDKTRFEKSIGRLVTVTDKHWSYKGYIILKNNTQLDTYLNKKLISTLNYQINIAKQKKKTRLNLELTRKPKLTPEEISLKNSRNSLVNTEKLRKSGKYAIEVYIRDTGELVGKYPLLTDFCIEYDFKPSRIRKVWGKGRTYYKGYNIIRLY